MWKVLAAASVMAVTQVGVASAQEGDAAAGMKVFNQCKVCHVIENNGKNGQGPNLHGVVGRKAASIASFKYSANMKELGDGGLVWTEDKLRNYLANPKEMVPKGIMAFPGLKQPQQVNDVIAYLKQNS